MILIYSVSGRLHSPLPVHGRWFRTIFGYYHFDPCKTKAVTPRAHVDEFATKSSSRFFALYGARG